MGLLFSASALACSSHVRVWYRLYSNRSRFVMRCSIIVVSQGLSGMQGRQFVRLGVPDGLVYELTFFGCPPLLLECLVMLVPGQHVVLPAQTQHSVLNDSSVKPGCGVVRSISLQCSFFHT